MYRILGDRVGTADAAALAEQLVSWHDAMVKHLRLTGPRRHVSCDDGCPHDEALSLWSAALATFGKEANGLAFLRTHGRGLSPASRSTPLEMRA